MDTVLARVGEICVHVTVLVAVPMIMTHITMNANGKEDLSFPVRSQASFVNSNLINLHTPV